MSLRHNNQPVQTGSPSGLNTVCPSGKHSIASDRAKCPGSTSGGASSGKGSMDNVSRMTLSTNVEQMSSLGAKGGRLTGLPAKCSRK